MARAGASHLHAPVIAELIIICTKALRAAGQPCWVHLTICCQKGAVCCVLQAPSSPLPWKRLACWSATTSICMGSAPILQPCRQVTNPAFAVFTGGCLSSHARRVLCPRTSQPWTGPTSSSCLPVCLQCASQGLSLTVPQVHEACQVALQRREQPTDDAALPPLFRPDVTLALQCWQGLAALMSLRMKVASGAILRNVQTCGCPALLLAFSAPTRSWAAPLCMQAMAASIPGSSSQQQSCQIVWSIARCCRCCRERARRHKGQ